MVPSELKLHMCYIYLAFDMVYTIYIIFIYKFLSALSAEFQLYLHVLLTLFSLLSEFYMCGSLRALRLLSWQCSSFDVVRVG